MFRNNMPFDKEKLSNTEINDIMDKTESKLGIDSGVRVSGGAFSAVASLAVMLVLVLAGAFVVNGALGSGSIEKDDSASTAAAPTDGSQASSDINKDLDSAYNVYESSSDIVSKPNEDEVKQEIMIEGVNINDIDVSVLSDGERFYYGPFVQAYLALDYDKYTMEPIVSENEHLRVTIESMICDDISVSMIATMEALDKIGEMQLHQKDVVPLVCAYDKNGNSYNGSTALWLGGPDSPSTDTGLCVLLQCANVSVGGEHEVYLKLCEFDNIDEAENPSAERFDVFDGIEFRLDTTSNIDMITLTADSGDAVYISPISFYDNSDLGKVSDWLDGNGGNIMYISYNAAGEPQENSMMSFGWYYNDISSIVKVDYNGQTYYLQ